MPEPADLLEFVRSQMYEPRYGSMWRVTTVKNARPRNLRKKVRHDERALLAKLRHHPFVAEFEPRHVERLAALAKEVRFDRDHIIFREGDECSEFYLIVNGLVALEIAAPGHTFRVQTLFAGDELGWSALLMGSGKHFQARALERVEALAFEGADLLAACREDTASVSR